MEPLFLLNIRSRQSSYGCMETTLYHKILSHHLQKQQIHLTNITNAIGLEESSAVTGPNQSRLAVTVPNQSRLALKFAKYQS